MAFAQLVYVSDLVNKDATELAPILESAVRRNSADGITGMLLYSDGNFLQVLEGTQENVRATYERICRDPRHRNITLLTEEEVPGRQFPHWSMGLRQLSPADIARFPQYAPFFQFGFRAAAFNVKPGTALELLELFSQGMV
jgi:hypothetical protein